MTLANQFNEPVAKAQSRKGKTYTCLLYPQWVVYRFLLLPCDGFFFLIIHLSKCEAFYFTCAVIIEELSEEVKCSDKKSVVFFQKEVLV